VEAKNMHRRSSLVTSLLVLALTAALAAASSASAAFSITDFSVTSTSSVAGAHPDLTTSLTFSTRSPNGIATFADGNVRDLTVDLPPGLVGNPQALPQCAQADFVLAKCPVASQVGVVALRLMPPIGFVIPVRAAVYNMEPRNGEETGEIAFSFLGILTVHAVVSVRTDGDYGLRTTATGTSRQYGVKSVALTLWGIPGDSSHDSDRFDLSAGVIGDSSQISRAAFLTNPTSCNGPQQFSASANSYQTPTVYSYAQADLPQQTGCDHVPFSPEFSFEPVETAADAPSAYHSVLTLPESKSPDGQATANLRNTVVSLPRGIAINPSGAVGLGGCDDVSLRLRSTAAADCPGNAKIGTAQLDVPVLPKPIQGAIYLRQPLPGHLFRIVLVANDYGVHLKIPGEVKADPATGQLTATFADTPQQPVRKLTLDFDGGPHAALVNPRACGTYSTHAEFTPWSSSTAVPVDSSFTIDQNCGRENTFTPGFTAGAEDPTAGARTPFHLRITRDSGPAVSTVDTTLPQGMLANIRGVPRCSEAGAAVGRCGPESQIGRTTVGAGAGTSPVFLPQAGKAPTAVYLAGPYKGAPFSLSIVVPAQAGPFDLGTVVVRAGLYVDPVTAQVTVKADPLPTILEGIPLNVRDIRVDIDRPGFTFNPTHCEPMSVTGTITSETRQTVPVSSPFQAVDCDQLDLTPDLDIALAGKGQTTDGKHPAVLATLAQPAGQSNLKQVEVTLPPSLALDPDNSQSDALCEFVDGRKTIPECPKSSIVGTATARTPILDQPLNGPVYFIKHIRTDPKSGRQIRTLPTLAAVLQGEGVTLVLRATSSVDDDDQLVTTFANIPDAPVSSFKLNINGGKKGILVISDADICKSTQILEQVTDGQNGKTRDDRVTIATPSCPLRVVGSSHTSSALKVKVGGLGAGRVSVSGSGLKTARRTIAESTVATLSLPLSASMRSGLARGHDVKVKVKVSFTPKGTKKAKKSSKTLVIHGAKR
jgi:hypothetical protein